MNEDGGTLHKVLFVAATVTLPIAWGLLVEWIGRVLHEGLSRRPRAEGGSETGDEGGADA